MTRQRILVLLLAAVLTMAGIILHQHASGTSSAAQARLISLKSLNHRPASSTLATTSTVQQPPAAVPTPTTRVVPVTSPVTAPPTPVTLPPVTSPVTSPPVTSPPVTVPHVIAAQAIGCTLTGPDAGGYSYTGYYSLSSSDGTTSAGPENSVGFDVAGSGTYTTVVLGLTVRWSYANGSCVPA